MIPLHGDIDFLISIEAGFPPKKFPGKQKDVINIHIARNKNFFSEKSFIVHPRSLGKFTFLAVLIKYF